MITHYDLVKQMLHQQQNHMLIGMVDHHFGEGMVDHHVSEGMYSHTYKKAANEPVEIY